jgi:hypothetical protein
MRPEFRMIRFAGLRRGSGPEYLARRVMRLAEIWINARE